MKLIERIAEAYIDEKLTKADGFDDAVIGIDASSFNQPPRIVYSVSKCIDILMKQMRVRKKDMDKDELQRGMTVQEKKHELAVEYFDFNVRGAYVGKDTPVWCDDEF